MKKIILTVVVLIEILSGCATSGNSIKQSSRQDDREFLIDLTCNFIDYYDGETNPLVKIVCCEKLAKVYEDYLKRYGNEISFSETVNFKNRIYELNEKADEVVKELDKLITIEKGKLNYSQGQYEKARAINDLKFANRVVKKEKSKHFNYFGLRVDIKNAAKTWKICDRVIKSKGVPELLRMKAGDHKAELMTLMRNDQEIICKEYPNFKKYSEYKDYPNWNIENAAILKYMNGRSESIELSEKEIKKSIKIVSNNL